MVIASLREVFFSARRSSCHVARPEGFFGRIERTGRVLAWHGGSSCRSAFQAVGRDDDERQKLAPKIRDGQGVCGGARYFRQAGRRRLLRPESDARRAPAASNAKAACGAVRYVGQSNGRLSRSGAGGP